MRMLRQTCQDYGLLGQGILEKGYMKINLPDDVRFIIDTLTENGYEAYAVGGCVRDSIIHRVPGDWDITTSALPQDVKKLFRRTIDTGIQHGTVTIMIKSEGYEVTTFRVDGEYLDGRHPENVEFTASLTEDLKRRDFTINAMAYNDSVGIVDEFDGVKDIEKGIIRCVGRAEDRFSEDALRMLRAVRFSAQLGYDIDSDTKAAIVKLAPTISKVSRERIHTEFGKTLLSKHPDYMNKACEYGITKVVFPIYDEIADKKLAGRLANIVPEDIAFRYAAFLWEFGRERCEKAMRELKLDNDTIKRAGRMAGFHGKQLFNDIKYVRELARDYGVEELLECLTFEECYYRAVENSEGLEAVRITKAHLREIIDKKQCVKLKDLAIDGAELARLGVSPGRDMGRILKLCLDYVIDDPECNTIEKLRAYAIINL